MRKRNDFSGVIGLQKITKQYLPFKGQNNYRLHLFFIEFLEKQGLEPERGYKEEVLINNAKLCQSKFSEYVKFIKAYPGSLYKK